MSRDVDSNINGTERLTGVQRNDIYINNLQRASNSENEILELTDKSG